MASAPSLTEAALRRALLEREAAGLRRLRRLVDGPQGPEVVVEGRRLLAFCSNDYLGLAADPRLAEAAARALRRHGTGSGASHLVSGHMRPHHELEEALADFTGRARALVFSTGYMANLGVVGALAGRGDTVVEDRLNHASLLDAARLAGARLRRYPHADAAAAARLLARAQGRRLLVTDGVFSMDGDVAPLAALAETARAHGAWLVVDDAHGLGVVGPGGRGSLEAAGLDAAAAPVLVGTLGKAFGTFGAFVAGSEALVETLIQQARSYIYTTALPPAVAEAAREAVRIAAAEPWRRERLRGLVARFRAGAAALGLPLAPSGTPIQPLIVGEAEAAVRLSRALEARGIWVPAIRPPTVPPGRARLRITLSAAHDEAHVARLLEALAEAWRGCGGG
ncbi:8-amino-7-oxononanoate synthase [Inmirania thermothiophila]|uniref:8-amino-7-oxononanoate synthase n=1 Tax=Inmirania thermothiophila TaxID=1750597 RepID=A0A3N1Y6R6_9GAMM|nr:8-amino-7-oxononanoate synthase [Inmirania thermothiophila]ROR34503.1 8-amino-7-oxononanoate synthase [Inmirania thermothiophila]